MATGGRERILEATYACVARYGLGKTTVEDAAREAGVSRATVYRHFPGGKDQLVAEVWEELAPDRVLSMPQGELGFWDEELLDLVSLA